MPNEKIMIIEDEPAIATMLRLKLQQEGYYQVSICEDGEESLEMVQQNRPDLIFLDLMLPGMNGLDVCRKLKSDPGTCTIPIIMLTAKAEENDIVLGLEMGADDYIAKPFSARILIARMRSVLRRNEHQETEEPVVDVLNFGPIRLERRSRTVFLEGEKLILTAGEFNLLNTLMENPNRVFTREQLICETRGDDYPVTERAIDVQITGLRKKLKQYASIIETIRGIGYRLAQE